MAEYNLSKIVDANSNTWNIKAKALESQITISTTGDVTGSATTDLSDSVSISQTIGDSKVTTSKIADSAVTTAKINDKAVTLDKLADSARSGSVSDNDGVLATHAQVKAAIDTAISGQGSYLGKQTVATINTWVAANLVNGDRVIASDAGTVTLGNISVRAGEDLIFWKNSDTAVWQSMDGEFKLKQTAKSDPTASGTGITYIATISQDANGEITATKSTVRTATTSQTGVVQLSSSSSSSDESKAATPKGVWNAINTLDATVTSTDGTNVQVKVTETDGKVSAVNITTDGTEAKSNKVTAWSTTTTDTNYPSEKLVKDCLDSKLDDSQLVTAWSTTTSDTNIPSEKLVKAALDGKQASGSYKTTQTAVSDPTASGTTITAIDTISQNTNGVITATKKTIRTATTSQTGVVQLSSSSSSSDESKAATPKGVWAAINTLDKSDTAVSNQFVTAVSETNGVISISRAQPTIANVSGLTDALGGKEASFTINYDATNNALVFSKTFGTVS